MPESDWQQKHPPDCNCPVCVPVHLYNAVRSTIQRAMRAAPVGYITVVLDRRKMAAIMRSIESRLEFVRRESATSPEAAAEAAELEQLQLELRHITAEQCP